MFPFQPVCRVARALLFALLIAAAGDTASASETKGDPSSLRVQLDGSTVDSGANIVDSGLLPGATQNFVFTIRNVGGSNLDFADNPPVVLVTADTDNFAIIQPALEAGDKLSPNASSAFRVDWMPDESDTTYSASIVINTDDPDSPFTMTLTLTSGTGPELEVQRNSIPLSSGQIFLDSGLELDVTASYLFTLENVSTVDLLFTGDPAVQIDTLTPSNFSILQPALEFGGKLSPSSSSAFRVDFTPDAPETTYSGTITIETNAAGSPFEIDLALTSAPPVPVFDVFIDIENALLENEFGGDGAAAEAYARNTIAVVDEILRRDVGIGLNVKEVIVWPFPAPFEVNPAANPSSNDMYGDYLAYCAENRSAEEPVMFQLFGRRLTSYSGVNGLASIGTPCQGYSTVAATADAVFEPLGESLDIVLSARGIGRNFTASNTATDSVMANLFDASTALLYASETATEIQNYLPGITCPPETEGEGEGEGAVEAEEGEGGGEGQPSEIFDVFFDIEYALLVNTFSGDAAAAEQYARDLFGEIDRVFRRDLGIGLRIKGIKVWESPAPFEVDPATEPTISEAFHNYRDYCELNRTEDLPSLFQRLGEPTDSYGGTILTSFGAPCEGYSIVTLQGTTVFPPANTTFDMILTARALAKNFRANNTVEQSILSEIPSSAYPYAFLPVTAAEVNNAVATAECIPTEGEGEGGGEGEGEAIGGGEGIEEGEGEGSGEGVVDGEASGDCDAISIENAGFESDDLFFPGWSTASSDGVIVVAREANGFPAYEGSNSALLSVNGIDGASASLTKSVVLPADGEGFLGVSLRTDTTKGVFFVSVTVSIGETVLIDTIAFDLAETWTRFTEPIPGMFFDGASHDVEIRIESTGAAASVLADDLSILVCEPTEGEGDGVGGGEAEDGCVPGQEPGLGGEGCFDCPPGSYSPSGDSCLLCPPGTANGDPGQAECPQCPPSTEPNASRTVCVPIMPEGEGVGCTAGSFHSADYETDNTIVLAELLRVIQLFNAGEFGCMAGTDDGFVPGGAERTCCPHASDYESDADWTVGLGELLRAVQFFNVGGYTACGTTEDGFCPGAP